MRIIGWLVVVALVIFVIGLFAGWFDLSRDSVEGRTRLGVEIDGSEVEKDVDETREAVGELGRKIGDALDGEDEDLPPVDDATAVAVEGVVGEVDAAERRLTLRTASGELKQLLLAEETEVELDGAPAELSELRPGDRVLARVITDDGRERILQLVASREQG